jgi:ribonuclease P protein component
VSVPKRTFKTAVQRNRLKRQIREAYRLHRSLLLALLPAEHPPVALMLMYVAKEHLPYQEIEAGILKMARKWRID